MPLKLTSSGGGSVTLDVPSTASDFTATMPANTGTVITTGSTAAVTQGMLASGLAGNGPAFSAYLGSAQSINNNVHTKLNINTENFDTASCFDTTLYRFTPNVAGYYFVTGQVEIPGGTYVSCYIYKNGTGYRQGVTGEPVNSPYRANVASLVYLNGSTDYIELYALQASGTSKNANAGNSVTFFDVFLARAA